MLCHALQSFQIILVLHQHLTERVERCDVRGQGLHQLDKWLYVEESPVTDKLAAIGIRKYNRGKRLDIVLSGKGSLFIEIDSHQHKTVCNARKRRVSVKFLLHCFAGGTPVGPE